MPFVVKQKPITFNSTLFEILWQILLLIPYKSQQIFFHAVSQHIDPWENWQKFHNVTEPHCWKVNIGSGNGPELPLSEPMLTHIYVAI